jgi:hypothetical protein
MLAITILDTRAADKLVKYPDLSGQRGRDMLFFGPPASGPGPVVNSVRQADGTIAARDPCCGPARGMFLGDYTNLILKPEAAEAVKKFGDLLVGDTVSRPCTIRVGLSPSLCDGASFRDADCTAERRGYIDVPTS